MDHTKMPFEEIAGRFDRMCRRLARAWHEVCPVHEVEDLHQMAMIGLWKAQERLKAGVIRPEGFPGYARAMARSDIISYLRSTNYLIRLPEYIIRSRRPGRELHETLQATQPLRLEGPAPRRNASQGETLTLADLIRAPQQDLDVRHDLSAALQQIPSLRRQMLLLQVAGYRVTEIARMTGNRPKRVEKNLAATRRQIQRALGA